MRKLVALLILGLSTALWPGPAAADALSEANRAYVRGDFLAAARLGAQIDTASGLALATRATLIHAEFAAAPAERPGLVGEAHRLARMALERDGENIEALMQMAAVTGYVARQKGAVTAHFQGLAKEGRGYLDRAFALDPENPWANALLGAWHLEVVSQGGRTLATVFYEANAETGIAAFEKALALDPDNPTLHTEFALALLTLDRHRFRPDAIAHLRTATALAPRTALDDLQRRRAQSLLTAAERGDDRALAREIREIRDLRRMAADPRPRMRNDE